MREERGEREGGEGCSVNPTDIRSAGAPTRPGVGRRVPVFFLTGGIEHVEERNLVVDHALLPIRIFDSLPNFARRYISQGQIIKTGGGGGVGLAPGSK